MVVGTTDKALNSNILKNPSFKTATPAFDVWKNLAYNPSSVTTAGLTTVRSNLFVNPSFEGTSGTAVIRTNLALNPRMTNYNFGGYGAQTLNAITGVTGHPEGITTAVRVGYTTGAGNPGAVVMPIPDINTQYSVSVWVYNEGSTTENIAIALKGVTSGGQQSVPTGVWTRLVWTMTTPAALGSGNDFGVRIGSPFADGSFLVTGVLIEKSPLVHTYFDGSKAAYSDFTHAWTGTAGNSTSAQSGIGLSNVSNSGTAYIIQSTDWASTGTKSLRLITAPNSTYPEVNLISSVSTLVPGKTYTVSGKLRLTQAGVTPFGRSRRFNFYWSSDNGVSWTESNGPQAPNAPGIYNVSFTFAVPSNANAVILRAGGNNLNTQAYQSDTWWDDILVEEGFLVRPFFDGFNPEYQNLCTNPSFATATTGWGANIGSYTLSRDASVGRTTLGSAKVYVNAAASGDINTFGSRAAAKPGDVISTSAWVKASEAKSLHIQLDFRNAAGTQISFQSSTFTVGTDWTRLFITATAPANTESVFVRIGSNTVQNVGFTYWVDDVVVEKSAVPHDFYEGTGEFTYAWSGASNNSTSLQQTQYVSHMTSSRNTGVVDSKLFQYQAKDENGNSITRWISPGGTPHSGWRVVGMGSSGFDYASVKSGKVYTLVYNWRASNWPTNSTFFTQISTGGATNHVIMSDGNKSLNVSGWQMYRRTFTALRDADSAQQVYISLPPLPSATDDSVFEISDWLILEGEYAGPVFNGASSALPGLSHIWNGTAHASTSSQRGVGVGDTYAAVSQVQNYQVTENGQTFWRSYVRNPLAFGLNTISANDRPAGTYTLLFKARVSTGSRQIRPRISGFQTTAVTLTTDWQEFRATTAVDGSAGYTGLVNTNSAAGWVVGDLVDIAYMAVMPGVYNGPYFDGNSTNEGDFTYTWDSQVNYSTSYQRAMNPKGLWYGQRASFYSSSDQPFSGSAKIKCSVTEIGYYPRVLTEVFVTEPGRRYTAFAKMKSSTRPVQIAFKWIATPDVYVPAASQSASNGNWVQVSTSEICPPGATRMQIYLGVPDSSPLGTEFEVDSLMLVSKEYDGPFCSGDTYGWIWEGTPHASTSIGYPVGMAQLAGKPLFVGTTAGTYVLTDVDPAKNPVLADNAPRTIYTVLENLAELTTGGIDVIHAYGIDSLNDTVQNKYLTMRQQSENGTGTNSLLMRRSGGAGALAFGLPTPGKQILIGGLDANGVSYAGYGKYAVITDVGAVAMAVPHERITIYPDNANHKHIATYIYPGVHSPAVRQEMVKLLAHEYSIPGM
jgi:hypothetical protein